LSNANEFTSNQPDWSMLSQYDQLKDKGSTVTEETFN